MFYLIVWCEDSRQWWVADECHERSLSRATALLHGRNPRLCKRGRPWAVVAQSDLEEALTSNPYLPLELPTEELVAA